ncbi:MAG: 4-(cytidine 5'-diphospho)-2-C-methyl-D-erythritol kinase [Chitinophagaceae bacterium]
MIAFPNCKINLGLRILNKREDGYHNLETIFYPVGWKDIVEVVRRDDRPQTTDHSTELNSRLKTDEIFFTSTGLEVKGDAQNNLCIKAYHILKNDFPSLPSIEMHLHKTIPMGAGLGGGSADGAFTLKLLSDKFQLGLTQQQLIDYALQLGSDCPFFILNKPCYATGRGEILEEVQLDLSAYHFVLVNPGIHVNTGWAFAQLQLNDAPRMDLRNIIQQPIHTWKEQLINDFEEPVCKTHPEIAKIKDELYNAGALYASMTGSGSTVYGIFEKEIISKISLNHNYLLKYI